MSRFFFPFIILFNYQITAHILFQFFISSSEFLIYSWILFRYDDNNFFWNYMCNLFNSYKFLIDNAFH